MSFATYQALIEALQGGYAQVLNFYKAFPSLTAGYFYSLWKQAGSFPAGVDPTPSLQGFALDKSVAGALPFVNPTAPKRLFLFSTQIGAAGAETFILYDRMWHVGGINLNISTTQTFTGTLAPTRHTDGIGNQLLLEITTAAGSTAQTLSITYINENDQSQVAQIAIPASLGAGRIAWVPLASGDLGVKSVVDCSVPAGMGGGVANLVMLSMKQFYPIGWASNQHIERETVLHTAALPEITADSCLAFLLLCSSTTAVILPKLVLVEG
jgi:hypothetical protein